MNPLYESPGVLLGTTPIHRVNQLDLSALPAETTTRLLVQLIHDPLGFPMSVPVLVMRGRKPGPVFGMTAAVHGDELNGIPVIHRIFDRIDPQRLRGTLVAVIVANVPAFIRHQRKHSDGTDLNHVMPGQPQGNAPNVYAHRLIDRLVRHFDVLVDMHTASRGRVNSLYIRADMTHPVCAQMAYHQRPQIIVHNPPADCTLRGAAQELGIPAITVEIGDPSRFQPELIRRSIAGMRAVLADMGQLPKRARAPGKAPVICRRSYWLYTDIGGLLEVLPNVTDHVRKGDTIARMTNIFGDVTRTYQAPEDGVVIGKSTDPASETGARILHLGILDRGDDEDPDAPRLILPPEHGRAAQADASAPSTDPPQEHTP